MALEKSWKNPGNFFLLLFGHPVEGDIWRLIPSICQFNGHFLGQLGLGICPYNPVDDWSKMIVCVCISFTITANENTYCFSSCFIYELTPDRTYVAYDMSGLPCQYPVQVSAVADEPMQHATSRQTCCKQRWMLSVTNLRLN